MIVDTVVLRKFRAACVSEITVEITAFLPCSLMRETEYNGGRFGCFMAGDVKRSRSIDAVVRAVTGLIGESWPCILREGVESLRILPYILPAVKRSTAEIQHSQTVKNLFATWSSGQAAKMTVKIS